MIPATCVDDFWDDPDFIRDYALSLDFEEPSIKVNFPGERTKSLHLIDKKFFDLSMERLMTLFFDDLSDVTWQADCHFQKIYSYHDERNHLMNTEWPHLDSNTFFAAVVYLNKDTHLDSGTTILHPKSGYEYLNEYSQLTGKDLKMRNDLYHNLDVDQDLYEKTLHKHNNRFDVTLEFKNRYNRLVAYNGRTWHRESNFCVPEEFRLTQIFFINKIDGNAPLKRLGHY